MSLPIEFHPHAEFEVEEARDWYLRVKKSPLAAARFVDELDVAMENIALQPERWPTYLSGTRRYLLARFPYLIIYRVAKDRIYIVAVAHSRRRPGYWRWRLSRFP